MTDFKCLLDLNLSWPYMHGSLCKGRAYNIRPDLSAEPYLEPSLHCQRPLLPFLWVSWFFSLYSVPLLTQNNRISLPTLQTKWITAPTLKSFLNTCSTQKLYWPSRNSRVCCAHCKPRAEWGSLSDTGQTWILFFSSWDFDQVTTENHWNYSILAFLLFSSL